MHIQLSFKLFDLIIICGTCAPGSMSFFIFAAKRWRKKKHKGGGADAHPAEKLPNSNRKKNTRTRTAGLIKGTHVVASHQSIDARCPERTPLNAPRAPFAHRKKDRSTKFNSSYNLQHGYQSSGPDRHLLKSASSSAYWISKIIFWIFIKF